MARISLGMLTLDQPPQAIHNNRNGTFSDVTRQAGLAVPMFGLGVAVGDYDNDASTISSSPHWGKAISPQQRQWNIH